MNLREINEKIASEKLRVILDSCRGRDKVMIVAGEIKHLDTKKVKVFLNRIKDLEEIDRGVMKVLLKWLGIYSLTE